MMIAESDIQLRYRPALINNGWNRCELKMIVVARADVVSTATRQS